jgi:hypothetical protein
MGVAGCPRLRVAAVALALGLASPPAHATFHPWEIREVPTNFAGEVGTLPAPGRGAGAGAPAAALAALSGAARRPRGRDGARGRGAGAADRDELARA